MGETGRKIEGERKGEAGGKVVIGYWFERQEWKRIALIEVRGWKRKRTRLNVGLEPYCLKRSAPQVRRSLSEALPAISSMIK